MLDVIKSIYEFKGRITNTTPFHIGSARSFSPIEVDNPVIRDVNNVPYIPGSSLRGIMRSGVEMLISSKKKENGWVCSGINTGEWCVKPEDRKEFKTEDEWVNYVINNACNVCKLFGSGVIASKVRIFDAYIEDTSDGRYTFVKDGVAIRRDTRTAKDKAKYDYEVVYPYNRFKFKMIVQNPEKDELQNIVKVLNMLDKGFLQIGGKKGAGLGRIRLEYTIREFTVEDILNGNNGREISKEEILKRGK